MVVGRRIRLAPKLAMMLLAGLLAFAPGQAVAGRHQAGAGTHHKTAGNRIRCVTETITAIINRDLACKSRANLAIVG